MMILFPDSIPPVVEKITCLFENDTIAPDYSYIEYLPDGRGFTFGKVGFTTATGDGFDVIREYSEANPGTKLAQYLPALQKLARKNSNDTAEIAGFSSAFQQEAAFTKFIQDKVAFELYGLPAINYCKTLGLKSTLALSIIYDAIVQHGDGKDDDGIRKIFKHTIKNLNGTPSGKNHKGKNCDVFNDEAKFLAMFLCERKEILEDANNEDSREEWQQSVERVNVFVQLLADKNFDLNMPLEIKSEDWNAIIK
jgi:chitosanase